MVYQNILKIYVKCHVSSFSKQKVEKLGALCCCKHKFAILYIKTFWKFTWNVTFQDVIKKVEKLGNVCVVININLQSATSKHFESLCEITLFKFF